MCIHYIKSDSKMITMSITDHWCAETAHQADNISGGQKVILRNVYKFLFNILLEFLL